MQQEAAWYRKLDHPNIAIFYAVEECNLILKYYRKGSLLDNLRHYSINYLLYICSGPAKAILYLHTKKDIIFRDLAIRNVLLHRNGDKIEGILTDFGSAISLEGKLQIHHTDLEGTRPIKNWPPEAVNDCLFSRSTDSFSFAWLLYEAIMNEHPYSDKQIADVSDLMKKKELHPPSHKLNKFPEDIVELMTACWNEFEPDKRPDFEKICECLGKYQYPQVSLYL